MGNKKKVINVKCKNCGSEMDLIDEDDVLGFKEYLCSNEDCNTIYTILGHQYDEGKWGKNET